MGTAVEGELEQGQVRRPGPAAEGLLERGRVRWPGGCAGEGHLILFGQSELLGRAVGELPGGWALGPAA